LHLHGSPLQESLVFRHPGIVARVEIAVRAGTSGAIVDQVREKSIPVAVNANPEGIDGVRVLPCSIATFSGWGRARVRRPCRVRLPVPRPGRTQPVDGAPPGRSPRAMARSSCRSCHGNPRYFRIRRGCWRRCGLGPGALPWHWTRPGSPEVLSGDGLLEGGEEPGVPGEPRVPGFRMDPIREAEVPEALGLLCERRISAGSQGERRRQRR